MGFKGEQKKAAFPIYIFSLRDIKRRMCSPIPRIHALNFLLVWGGKKYGCFLFLVQQHIPTICHPKSCQRAHMIGSYPDSSHRVHEITKPFFGFLCLQAGHDLLQAHWQQAVYLWGITGPQCHVIPSPSRGFWKWASLCSSWASEGRLVSSLDGRLLPQHLPFEPSPAPSLTSSWKKCAGMIFPGITEAQDCMGSGYCHIAAGTWHIIQ